MTGSRLILALLSLGLVFCLAPIGMGFVIEQTYGSVIETVQENAEDSFSISGEFDRGLWSSSAITRIDWPDGEAVELDQVWIHGPVPLGELLRGRSPWSWVFAVVEATMRPESEAWPHISTSLDGGPWVESRVRIYFDRSVRFDFSLAAMESEDPPLVSEGIWGEGSVTSDSEARIQSEIRFGRVSLGEPGQLAWDGALLSLDRALDEQGLTTLQVALDVGVLQFLGEEFDQAGFELALRRVDPSASQALGAALSEADASPLPDAERAMLRTRLLGEGLPRVLRGSPEIELSRLALRSPERAVELRARVGVDGSDPTLLTNPLFVMGLVQAEANILASRTLVEQALDFYLAAEMAQSEEAEGLSQQDMAEMAAFMREAALGAWVAGKRIVLEEDQFKADVEFDGGVLILNGEMLDPTELSNPLSSM